ncbi:DUF11 domain-containing protein [Myroides sp. C15-4]|uniref:DUF11 domain-containing protein n=1 Tax=Myroides sp. C15-4 TaxID=3400532 RepID=UPI003D2F53A4
MKEKTTFSLWMRVLLFLVLLVPLVHGYGQNRVFATRLFEHSNVTDPNHTVDGNLATSGTLKAKLISNGKLTVGFEEPILVNQAVYIKIKADDNQLLQPLLGGTLGGLLDGVLGGLLGSHSFTIDAYNDDTLIFSESTSSISGSTKLRIVQDKAGDFLIAIRVSEPFNKLKITNFNKGLIPLLKAELDVYGAFYEGDTLANCEKPIGTSFDSAGIKIDLLKDLVAKNYAHAIDDDLETYSKLKFGGGVVDINLGGHLSQFFYFPTKSSANASFNIKLGPDSGLITANVINSLEVRAFDGDEEVYLRSLKGGLLNGTNLLNLLEDKGSAVLTFAPGLPFDRVEVRVNNTVNIGVLQGGIRIYDVERFDGVNCINPEISTPTPTQVPFETASCATSLVEFQNVDFPTNVLDNNNETYATLYADAGALLASPASQGMIHMAYPNQVPANTTSYIRIDAETDLLNSLVGGTLGKLLGDVLGVVLGNHYFEIEAYNGSTLVSESTSANGFSSTTGGKMTVVQDRIGRYYLAVTPNQPYQSIKITNKVLSIPNGAIRTLKVYNMCREMGTDACFPPQFTSYDISGINVSVGNLNTAGVTNPYHAISGNSSEYAEISTGLLGVAATVKQLIYFTHPSQGNDQLKVRLQLDPSSLLSADLLGRYRIVTYLGDQEQEVFTLRQGLINNLDLLSLFKSGGTQTLTFDTTQLFDRVEIQASTLVGVGVTPPIRLYDVKRVSASCPETITPSPFIAPICATTLVDASNVNDLSNLFDDDFDSFSTLQSGAGFLLGLGNKFEGFVELGYTDSIPAYTTSYVRIDFEETALEKLIGGSLGNLVTGVLDGLVFGKHDFEVQVKDKQGNVILNRNTYTTNASSSEGTIKVVVDKEGRTYLAITPTSAYQSVRIIDKTNSALGLLSQPNSMNVYGMCYETAMDPCVAAFATSYEYEGVNLSVNALGGAGVTNPERAIDDNTTHASKLSLGTLNVAGQVKQWFYFNSLSEIGDVTNIRLKAGTAGLVTLPILEKLEIAAYKGDTFVDRLDWDNGLLQGTEVLELLNSSSIIDLPFKPNGQYDRISIGLKSLVSVDVLSSLDIYKVERLCKPLGSDQKLVSWKSYKVNDDATVTSVSGGEQVEYTIHVKNVGDTPISQFNITDKLPAGTTFSSAIEGHLSTDGTEVLFDFSGTMNPGSERQFVFHVMVQSDLAGILEIKNIAFTKESGSDLSYPSYPPVDNTNPTEADMTKSPGTIIHVSHVASLPKAIITSNKAQDLCAEETFVLDSNISNTEADTYQWYFNGEAIDATIAGSTNPNYGKEKTLETNHAGSYTVVYTKGAEVAESSDPFVVTQLPSAVIQFSDSQRINVTIPQGQSTVTVTLPTASVPGANGTETITWYNNHAAIFDGTSITFDTPGVYVLTVVATALNQCETFENVIVTVYDSSLCPPTIERVYATGSSSWGSIITGGVSGTSNTIDGDPTTHSTLTTGIGLLGIGTVWQNIYFEEEVAAGTPVTIKLGKQYSGLMLAGGISVVGLDANGNTIGTLKSVQGGLLDLLAADNVVEFTFVPSNSSGPKKYKGVRVSQGSLLSVAQIAKVYHAYYTENVSAFSPKYCEPVSDHVHPAVLDVLHGVQDLGLGVASATASVVNPWNAVDGNLETHATISRGVAVLNAASLTVIFKQQAMPGDKLHIVTKVPGNPILSLELIKGYKIQRYLGDQKVGEEIDGTNGAQILDLKLLGLGYRNKYKMIIKEIDQPFDRVKISYGSVVGVLGDFTNIYEVTVAPRIDVGIDIEEEYLDMCQGGVLTINVKDGCSTYEVYAEETGGTPLPTDGLNNFRLPYYLPEYQDELPEDAGLGPKYSVVYVQTYRNGCVIGRRLPIRLNMRNCSVKSNLNVTQQIK